MVNQFEYILKDRYTGINYGLYVEEGILTYTPTNALSKKDPVVKDSVTGIFYVLYIYDGILTWDYTNERLLADVYMYDAVLNVWWIAKIVDGIFTYDLISPPGGSKGFYPVENYYKYLFTERIDIAWTMIGKSSRSTTKTIQVKAKKRFKIKKRLSLKSKKLLKARESKIPLIGRKSFTTTNSLSLKGRLSRPANHNIALRGRAKYKMQESIRVKAKRNLIPILEAIDIL